MKIILTGGGTAGHIMPTLAVAHELKRLKPDCRIIYMIERSARFGELVTKDPSIDKTYFIFAGKLRRYHGESWLKRLIDVKTNLLNLRDVFFLIIGFVQSWWLLTRLKPAVVFVKGGYVGLPVGAAAALGHRPIITHDSDTLPGLTNRIVSRWARITTTAFPAEFYTYPTAKVRHVGVPVSEDFKFVDTAQKQVLRQRIKVSPNARMLFVTGGSLGAKRLNQAVATIAPKLLDIYPDLVIVHQTGKDSGDNLYAQPSPRIMVQEFVRPLADYSGAADVVLARPGATTMAELAAQTKACIVVPSPFLAEGHQLKNAAHLAEQGTVISLEEGQALAERLLKAVQQLLDHPDQAKNMAQKFHELLRPDAAHSLAMLLLEQATH